MSIFDGLARRLGYAKAGDIQRVARWMSSLARGERFMIPDGSGIETQERLYKKLSWIQIAVSILARSAATGGFSVYSMVDERLVDIPNHDFERLIRKPNPHDSRFELLERTYSDLALTGNAYWWLNRMNADSEPAEIWPIPPRFVQPVPDERMYLRGYEFLSPMGQRLALETWEVVHFKRYNSGDVFVGLSPIEAIATQSSGDMKMSEFNTRLYGDSNGRMPGILAFADPINDEDWKGIQDDTKKASKQQSFLLVRNAGKGGVEYISTAVSQKDMEYISIRAFTKEEIFDVFAPGLASMLAISATEANAKAGATTFDEFARWPLMQAVGEKITNDVLPAYGDDLVGMFDEIRQKDQRMRLRDEEAYSRVHTVDEVRVTYYGDEPIGGERGELFPAEIIKSGPSTSSGSEAIESNVAQPLKPGARLESGFEEGGQNDPSSEPLGSGKALNPPQPPFTKGGKDIEEELARWQRKAIKAARAGKSADVEFETEIIPVDAQDVIHAGLKVAGDEAGVRGVFESAPGLIQPGQVNPPIPPSEATPQGGLKAARRPKYETFEARADWEEKLGKKISAAFRGEFDELMKLLGDPPRVENVPAAWWDGKSKDLRRLFEQALEEIAMARAREFITIAPIGGVDWTQVNEGAVNWARDYSFDLVKDIDDVTRQGIIKEVQRYYQDGLTVDDIARNLEKYYSKERAGVIAVTETTRAAIQGEKATIDEIEIYGLKMKAFGITARDDIVCEVCGPKDGQELGDDLPPWHPNCRCGARWEIEASTSSATGSNRGASR